MNPTSFFLLTLLLVLVTEPAVGRPRERFSQDTSSEDLEVKVLGSSGGSSSIQDEYSHSESSWSSFKSKSPKTTFTEEIYEERREKPGDGDLSFKTRGSQDEGMSSYKSRTKTRITGK
ncbi:seminal vesicle secretory protein 5-like [Cricetulus griseus]|uniref:Seminal vesicle secretory protein 5-like n=1 Tax=Cricetulus griseus TaxID=10029 RepID=A0A9J7K733_CRIGR|nr:seminal vesicle secretory protein 5-like [Cricetulus griseus]XP_035313087.1 seminal vesicle secretory protein 5-like [Cricetulus griseus]